MVLLSARALEHQLGPWRRVDAPAYAALADRIRLLILDGRITLGSRLPAERELSAHLALSRTTVTAAYATLRDAGYLESVRGSGSVARLPQSAAGFTFGDEIGLLDFSKATLPAIPTIAAAASRAAAELPDYLGESGFDPIGLRVLRQAIASRYAARGLATDADQIMVTLGAQHAIALLARTVMARGDSALVELPSYPHAFEALRSAGGRFVPVSVTADDGWDELALEQALQRTSPSFGYLMPDFHNPTGQTMTPDLRLRTIELAVRAGTTLVADETMAELAIDDVEQPLPFAAYAPRGAESHAVLVGSVGKTVWGGLRVGWVRAERPLITRLARNRASGDLGTPVLEQLIVKNLLDDYDGILAIRRAHLRAGRDHLAALLKEQLPGWIVPRVPGGITAWVNLGAPLSSQLTLAARAEGLLLAAGPRFGVDGSLERFIRIPFSHSPADIDRAVAALVAAWESVTRWSPTNTEELVSVV